MATVSETFEGLLASWASLDVDDRLDMLQSFALRYCYHSGKIENELITLHDTQEIFDHGRVVSYTGDVRTLFEIANLKNSWEWALEHASPTLRLDEGLLLEAHELLCRGTYDERRWSRGERPGTYKVHDYAVGVQEIGYPPEEVSQAVQELLAEVGDKWGSEKTALTVAAYLHAKLVEIHPFADGNGRVSRLMMNLALLSAGLPPISVDEADRISYYGALDAFHDEGDLTPFIDFCKVECIKSWDTLL